MPRIFVIFNPAARGEKSQQLRRFLEAKQSACVTLAPTERTGDATRLAAQADPRDIVVAAGGDGTINEVVNGLTGGTLGILPLGTVNVFAKELGIPANIESAWRVIEAGQTRLVDLGCAEFAGQRRAFVQLAGVGFDARAVRAASWQLKKRIGPLAYVWAGLKTLTGDNPPVSAGNHTGAAIFIGNGRFYGGRFPLFPAAKLDDGLLDVCVLDKLNLMNLGRYGPAILFGKHPGLRGVRYFQTAELTCRSVAGTPFELDGEDAGDVPVTFSLKPRALRLIVRGDFYA
ncbi:MAG: Diacylglycerol kinase [Verrucomicrobiae bacterium]|nr:Diacylglycerol kinase [Verrucomicrobiae bacterium]